MAESGHQSGALEAALVSNVTLTSIADLTERLRYDLAMTKLAKLEHRADEARERYWALGKYVRIDAGLRPEVGEAGYSGNHVIAGVDLSGKRAIVTGGASGIGVETARALASAGAEVTLAVRNLAAGEQARAAIEQSTANGRVRVLGLDLADLRSVATFATLRSCIRNGS